MVQLIIILLLSESARYHNLWSIKKHDASQIGSPGPACNILHDFISGSQQEAARYHAPLVYVRLVTLGAARHEISPLCARVSQHDIILSQQDVGMVAFIV